MRFDKFQTFLFIFGSGIELINVLAVFRFQPVDNLVSTFRILLVQIVRNLNQCVCGTRHGRENHNLTFTIGNQFGHFLHSLSRTY
ncbi:unknown [Bacteroides clarus CAG:160]|nr:unknown [Bacteroides clarus CAG:160]